MLPAHFHNLCRARCNLDKCNRCLVSNEHGFRAEALALVVQGAPAASHTSEFGQMLQSDEWVVPSSPVSAQLCRRAATVHDRTKEDRL